MILRVQKLTSSNNLTNILDDRWFSGGLLGPDGSHWHLGKWCKKVQNQGSTGLSAGLQGSNARTGDLIAVGADGRGGQIKVMRSLNQCSSVGLLIHPLDFPSEK